MQTGEASGVDRLLELPEVRKFRLERRRLVSAKRTDGVLEYRTRFGAELGIGRGVAEIHLGHRNKS